MEYYSDEQRVKIVKIYFKNQCSVQKTFRTLFHFYSPHNRHVELTIRRREDSQIRVNRFDK